MQDQPLDEQAVDLVEARDAYAEALQALENVLPQNEAVPVVIDPGTITWRQVFGHALMLIPMTLFRLIRIVFGGVWHVVAAMGTSIKERLVRAAMVHPSVMGETEQDEQIRLRLLDTLWARDHVQQALERRSDVSYAIKRSVLSFVIENETRLQRLGQLALEVADLEPADLRDAQPMEPDQDSWWWFLNYPRAKRARRMNTVWFAMAIIPALASLTLITLLAQRLALNGPDLLSGASVVAQVGLGLGSIIAGRQLMDDLIMKGARVSWQGQVTFALASVFLIVVVIFYFLAPPAAAVVYNVFGQQAIKSGNAAEAELYLESAARLDPDPHAADLSEVGCLYQTLGSPDRAETVFERVLEADSRLLLARYHLAELYSNRGDYAQALQLLEDGLNLLNTGRERMRSGDYDFLPGIDSEEEADEIEYLLLLARGRAYVESGAPEQAKGYLRDAEDLYSQIEENEVLRSPGRRASMPALDESNPICSPSENLVPYILSTELNLHYHLARTYDALCNDAATATAALQEWRFVRNGLPTSFRQETWQDEAANRLSTGTSCLQQYGQVNNNGV
jgi:tetratricopeptide (TPR) repeat protein